MGRALNILYKLEEMATVYSSPVFQIKVYSEPLGNPSFHLIKPNMFEVVLKIKDLKVLEVKFDKLKRKKVTFKLSSKELKKLKTIFCIKDSIGDTNWKQIIFAWNILNPKYKLDLNTINKYCS